MGLRHRLTSAYFPKHREQRALGERPVGASVLMYHEVLPDAFGLPVWSVVRESAFRQQVQHLKRRYRVLPLDELLHRLDTPSAVTDSGPPMAAITFDDGYAGNLNCAAPILRDAGLPYTVYIASEQVEQGGLHWYDRVILALLAHGSRSYTIKASTGAVSYSPRLFVPDRRWAAIEEVLTQLKGLPEDERESIAAHLHAPTRPGNLRMLTPAEVQQLAKEPDAAIGCHTHGHELLDTIPIEDARLSITHCQERLNEWTGRPVRHFSYPNGNHSHAVTKLVGELGFASAVTTRNAIWTPGTDRLRIPRIGIGRFDNLNLFRAKVAGLFAAKD
jgi:peptidoglycan/xylan/chitin deacetylase (PgdA/CDA1 family)